MFLHVFLYLTPFIRLVLYSSGVDIWNLPGKKFLYNVYFIFYVFFWGSPAKPDEPKLLNYFVFSFILITYAFTTDVSASHPQNTNNTQENTALIADISAMIDFDGGHYYYIKLENQDNTQSSWELASEADFRLILKDNWEVGDEIIMLDEKILWNITKDSQYYFYSIGNWWHTRKATAS